MAVSQEQESDDRGGDAAGAPLDLDVRVASAAEGQELQKVRAGAGGYVAAMDPEALNGTNLMRLFVFGNPDGTQARLVAQLDNLGKGASGAAVQNLNLMLGLGEAAGL